MISDLETKSSKKLTEELSNIFTTTTHEIETLAEKAPNQIIESVHLIRKRLKFLRAFVKLTQFCSDDENYKSVNYILRDCGRNFSDCRDAHVRGILLNEFSQDNSVDDIIQELTELNKSTTSKLERELIQDTDIFGELISDITGTVVIRYINALEADAICLTNGLTLGYRKSYHAFHSELKSHEADLLHEWRKRTKDLQYQLEALIGSIPDELSPSYDEVAVLCELLGRINDLFMLLDWLDSAQNSIKTEDQIVDLKSKLELELKNLENQADKAGHSIFTLNPDDYSEVLNKSLE